jgi:hypothetical protein
MKGREGDGRELRLAGVAGLKGQVAPSRSSASRWGSRTLPGPAQGKTWSF